MNSTAMLIELVSRGEQVDAILFADTGGERPEIYDHVSRLSAWSIDCGYPPIITVEYRRRDGSRETLEDRCLSQRMLPSLAYGYRKCSQRFKQDPQHAFIRGWSIAIEALKSGQRITKLIGFDADEPHRFDNAIRKRAEREKAVISGAKVDNRWKQDVRCYQYRYPLIEWDMGRAECEVVIRGAGFIVPGKSACFFCPSTSISEMLQLSDQHPDLLQRALAIEANAVTKTEGRGLGGAGLRWEEVVDADSNQPELFKRRWVSEIVCECYDGD